MLDKYNKEIVLNGSQSDIDNQIVSPFFCVFNVVRKLREQRWGMVTDTVQYKYIYEFITEWVRRNFELK